MASASGSGRAVDILSMRFLKISSLLSARSSRISLSLASRSLSTEDVCINQNFHRREERNIKKNVLLVVGLHLREELRELSADLLSDSRLHQEALRSLLLQLDL